MASKPDATPVMKEETASHPAASPAAQIAVDAATLKDLAKLLGDKSDVVKSKALTEVASLSSSIDGRASVSAPNAPAGDLIRILVRMIGDTNPLYVKDAMTALINFAEVAKLAQQMVERNVVSRVLDLLLEASSEIMEAGSGSKSGKGAGMMPLYIMLLSNVTRFESGAKKLLNMDEDEKLRGYYISKLIPLFLRGSDVNTSLTTSSGDSSHSDSKKENRSNNNKETEVNGSNNDLTKIGSDKTSWIGSILVNGTQILEGRQIFTNMQNRYLKLMISQISSVNPLRRRAALGVVRNCMFESTDHQPLLLDADLAILPSILLPLRDANDKIDLNDPKEIDGMPLILRACTPSKKREPDIECRKLIYDTLTLFTASKFGREYLKSNQVYTIVREAEKGEANEAVQEKIYDLVHVLVLDEPEDEESNQDGKNASHMAPISSNDIGTPSSSRIEELPDAPAPTGEAAKPAPDYDEHGEEIEEI